MTPEDIDEVWHLAQLGLAVEQKLGHRVSPKHIRSLNLSDPQRSRYSFAGHDDWVAVTRERASKGSPIVCIETGEAFASTAEAAAAVAADPEIEQTNTTNISTSIRRVLLGMRPSCYGLTFRYLVREDDGDGEAGDGACGA